MLDLETARQMYTDGRLWKDGNDHVRVTELKNSKKLRKMSSKVDKAIAKSAREGSSYSEVSFYFTSYELVSLLRDEYVSAGYKAKFDFEIISLSLRINLF